MQYDVFVSHSSKDKPWADRICVHLEQQRIKCWIAPRDIAPGTEWGAAIIEGIDACAIVLLIFSSDANQSGQVRREVERAISKGRVILPVRIENVQPAAALEFALSNTHWLDAFPPPHEPQLNKLTQTIQRLLESPVPASASGIAPPPLPSTPPLATTPFDLPKPASRRWRWIGLAALGLVMLLTIPVWWSLNRPEPSIPVPPVPEPIDERTLARRLQGPWQITSRQGMRRGTLPDTDERWVFRGDTLIIPLPGDRTVHCKYHVWEDDGIAKLDAWGTLADNKKLAYHGILEFVDNKLRICFRIRRVPIDPLPERPTTFDLVDSEPAMLVEFARPLAIGSGR